MKYQVIKKHKSENPNPVIIFKGDKLIIGEKYHECEDWDDWYFCETPNHIKGRVPKQVIKWLSSNEGEALANYFAKEMDVEEGDLLTGTKKLNGWVWCLNLSSQEAGWVPIENLVQI
jgi:hypothetical protein